MKFSNIRAVRSSQIGLPLLWIMPSRTVQVSGAQLTLTQPSRFRPLKSGTKPVSSCGARTVNMTPSAVRIIFIRGILADGGVRRGSDRGLTLV